MAFFDSGIFVTPVRLPMHRIDMIIYFYFLVMYESFRQLILDAENKDGDRIFSAMELTFR